MLSGHGEFNPDKAFGWIDLRSRKSIILAVSGGSDSTALLMAFKQWVDEHHPKLRLICVTIDHGLRPEAAAEARQVAAFCAQLSVIHKTVRWQDEKPATGVAVAAREARYRLLAQAARDAGTDIILTGHTADDQAETVLMRSARGPGRGMAGMARLTLFDGQFWIARPFLMQSREALRQRLRVEGVVWIDDPTNFDDRHERIRARQQLAEDPDRYSMVERAQKADLARTKLAEQSAELLKTGAAVVAPGLVKLDLSLLNTDSARSDMLRILLACCGGRPFPAGRLDVASLIERLERGRTCLTGTVATKKRDGVYLHRELRSDDPLQFRDGIFDGRYRLSRQAIKSGWRLQTRDPKSIELQETGQAAAPIPLIRAALAAEPVLVRENETIEPDSQAKIDVKRYLAPFDHFLPEFDLTLANAAATLFGRDSYPSPPVR